MRNVGQSRICAQRAVQLPAADVQQLQQRRHGVDHSGIVFAQRHNAVRPDFQQIALLRQPARLFLQAVFFAGGLARLARCERD